MRLHTLTLTNFGPHRHLSLTLSPLTVVTGGNGTGKSHIAEALRLALTGDWLQRGLSRKGDRSALLSEGATLGTVVLEGDGFRAAVNLKSGKIERTPGPVAYLDVCCDPRRIGRMLPDELRETRARAALLRAKAEDPLLLDAAARIERLRADLEAAEAEPPPVNAPERVKIAQAAAADLEAAQHAVRAAAAEKLSAETAPRITPCPHCTGPLTTTTAGMIVAAGTEPARDHARIARAVREHAIAQENLRAAESRLDDVIRADAATRESGARAQRDRITDLRAKLRAAESAAAELQAARAALAALGAALSDAPGADDAAERAAAIATALCAAQDRQRQMQKAEIDAAAAIDRTARAAAAHADAQAWVALGEAVEALPAEMLARGLAPLNAALRDLASSDADWLRAPDGLALAPLVTPDMAILCGQRPYRALPESEQWRVDAVLGTAIAALSDHRILILDRLDVVQPDLRAPVLAWLRGLLGRGLLHTAVVLATTREPFRVPDDVGAVRLTGAGCEEAA